MESQKYFLLSALFIVFFLIVEYTEIYGNSAWFKAFLLLSGGSFLISGLSLKK